MVRSIDTIFLLNSPVLTKFSCKVCSIAKTCFKQKARITLKHGKNSTENLESYVAEATEIIISYEEVFVEFEPISNKFFRDIYLILNNFSNKLFIFYQ